MCLSYASAAQVERPDAAAAGGAEEAVVRGRAECVQVVPQQLHQDGWDGDGADGLAGAALQAAVLVGLAVVRPAGSPASSELAISDGRMTA